MDKPTIYYTEVAPIIVGNFAIIRAHNHPSRPTLDNWDVRTSIVQSYDLITGDFETRNSLYKLRVEIKSVPKSNHETTKDAISGDKWVRPVPLTERQIAAFSDGIKHVLTEMGDTYKYITCDDCTINSTCTLAFDIYNTDGDCLLK